MAAARRLRPDATCSGVAWQGSVSATSNATLEKCVRPSAKADVLSCRAAAENRAQILGRIAVTAPINESFHSSSPRARNLFPINRLRNEGVNYTRRAANEQILAPRVAGSSVYNPNHLKGLRYTPTESQWSAMYVVKILLGSEIWWVVDLIFVDIHIYMESWSKGEK